jgi:D-alanyl-D-alanine carboxypeptidase
MTKKHTPNLTPALSTALIILLLLTGYFVYKTTDLNKTVASISDEKQSIIGEKNTVNQTLLEATETISKLEEELAFLAEDYNELEDDYRDEKNKNDDFQDQIDNILGTVGSLDKLSKTDKELLQKYSKVYFLNENYIPSKVREIDEEYILAGRQPQYFHGDALPFLEKMLDRAERSDIDLKIVSAYRSFDSQTELKAGYKQTYGSGANAFSADQGYSEHQLGTTLDLSTQSVDGPYLAFKDTEGYQWMLDNGHKYGFTLSYPEDNSFYIFEPWHWRFVGEDLAEYLYDNDLDFYDMEQREIDQYLIKIFD